MPFPTSNGGRQWLAIGARARQTTFKVPLTEGALTKGGNPTTLSSHPEVVCAESQSINPWGQGPRAISWGGVRAHREDRPLLDARYAHEEEAEEIERPAAETLDAVVMATLPGDFAGRLRDAATDGDFDAMLGLADEVGRFDKRSAAGPRTSAERSDSERIFVALLWNEES